MVRLGQALLPWDFLFKSTSFPWLFHGNEVVFRSSHLMFSITITIFFFFLRPFFEERAICLAP